MNLDVMGDSRIKCVIISTNKTFFFSGKLRTKLLCILFSSSLQMVSSLGIGEISKPSCMSTSFHFGISISIDTNIGAPLFMACFDLAFTSSCLNQFITL